MAHSPPQYSHKPYRDSDIDTIASAPALNASASPEDERFDHASIQEASSRSVNLVRGASARSKGAASHYTDGRPLSYIDENFNHYSKDKSQGQDESAVPLVHNAADIGGYSGGKPGERNYEDLEYADPHIPRDGSNKLSEKAGPLARLLGQHSYPLEQRIEDKKRGVGRQRFPFVVWTLTAAMVGAFIYELVLNNREQGSPVSFHPVVNYMLGPSSSALINAGARFPPCMKLVEDVPPSFRLGCMNNTDNPVTQICTVADLCGFGGITAEEPNQWFRFITAIFLHAGFVHILLNMFAQLTLSAQIEREMGSGGFLLTYMAAGIFGNILGGNFSLVGIPSVGASGAIFGTVAVTWIDLFAHWQFKYRPRRMLVFMIIELAIGIAIGYIPYVDNFAHLGGLFMGFLFGLIFYPVISLTRRHSIIMWSCRIAAIPVAIVLFVILTRNFYTSDPYAACQGCRYLSCIPTDANDHCKGTGLTTTSSS